MQIGQVISGKYRLMRLLGDGGMGSVYEAFHEGLGTRVAIKVLHPELARRPGLVERFLREARVSAQIRSPNVVQVMDVDRTADGAAYIVMELLEGEPLSSVLERDRKLSISTAVDYTTQILQALEAAHALGVIHRDLKPENVFVTFLAGKSVLKLIDFGIAKARQMDSQNKNLTVAGVVMGTAEYMAPEQARSADQVDVRSDLYAVGVMLYEMIAGVRPVAGDDARIIALKVERGDVRPLVHAVPDVPRDLAGLVHRAMAPRPELRFSSATEMKLALAGAAAGKRAPTVPLPERGTGTVMGAPTDAALLGVATTARAPAGPAPVHGAPANLGPGQYPPQPGVARTSPPGAYGGSRAVPGATPGTVIPSAPHGYRPRKRGSSAWLLIALPILLGAGVAIAFAVNGSGDVTPPPQATTPNTVTATSPAVTTAPSPTTPTTTGNTVAPLIPTPPPTPTGHGTVRPHPTGSTTPPSNPSTSPTISPFPTGFPTAFPSSFPNPFPTGSGVGPVLTIPTTLPSTLPFPLPQAPAPTAPAPTSMQ
jgi:serine/threonine protein kinase